ncbi:TetR family transcriptional regulator [Arthrobacter jiangjiafuii]|uniref:TetR family transcriptional regulator n=1 Tax=Arthrobacter jiangjiafuii TaxID=2817475 RepID=A0A975R0X0_9MICC|nr:TetR family transcriptional regulator [Arthrobacter jiangjiafuii]MBP3042356.1 TetR family transcriptional regulator [Arthrobacter jiangjiafuii]QWC09891.1 TetR family transcriptional regulator [Arthrobacter jiangjiafuii]
MFRPGAPIEEIEQDVEAMIIELVHELGRLAEADPDPIGAQDRAYIKAFSDAGTNSETDQGALLATAVARPNLAESLIYLNRRLDRDNLDPKQPSCVLGVIIRLAMDGLWVSDILDATRFEARERTRITGLLTALSRVSDGQLGTMLKAIEANGAGTKG